MSGSDTGSDYPVTFSVDYPDRDLNRTTTFFRVFAAIPILILIGLLSGESFSFSGNAGGGGASGSAAAGAGGILFLAVALMLVFRAKYPRWWFDFNLQLQRFGNRVFAYLLLMDDRYPATDDDQSVHLDYPYPGDSEETLTVSRVMPIFKWLLAIPHYIVLFFLAIAGFFVVVFAWLAILFTGRYPRGAFDFLEGVLRWENRVAAYAFTLVTDEYPPFSLKP